MFCSYCGHELPDNSKYCRYCSAQTQNKVDCMAPSGAQTHAVSTQSPAANKKNNFAVAGLVLSLVASSLAPFITYLILERAYIDFFVFTSIIIALCVVNTLIVYIGLAFSAAGLHDAVKRGAPKKGIAIAGVAVGAVKLIILLGETMLIMQYTATMLAMFEFIKSLILYTINFFI